MPSTAQVPEAHRSSDDQGHAHGHQHQHHHHSFAQANADYFDKKVDEYENVPGARELMSRIGIALRETSIFDKQKTSVLDFACGIGMLSNELVPVSKSIVGIDISKNSVEAYNRRAASLGAAPEQMRAVALDIIQDGIGALEGTKFDVAVCSMAYHHFEHPDQITRAISELLNPGGILLVLDFQNGLPAFHGKLSDNFDHVVPHRHGFSEAEMKTIFESGGMGEFKFTHVCRAPAPMPKEAADKLSEEERMIDVFLAEGKKASS